MNEQYFSVVFVDDDHRERYGYIEYGLLRDVMDFAHTMGDSGLTTEVNLDGDTIVSCIDDEEWTIENKDLYWQLTHWEANASWWYGDVETDNGDYGEFVSLGFFDSEGEAICYTLMLANEYSEEIADDIRLLDADMMTLDVRAAGPNCFESSVFVLRDGRVLTDWDAR